jgi:hypothetical protein
VGGLLLAAATVGCASAGKTSEAERLMGAPKPITNAHLLNGHVPSQEVVLADRDELMGVLDSLYAHYSKESKRATTTSRWVALSALVVGGIGAISPAIVDGDKAERKLSQIASFVTALLGGIATEYQLSRKSEAHKACTVALYHAVSDVRLRYSPATLPTSDTAWNRYVYFKDSVDRAVNINCQ